MNIIEVVFDSFIMCWVVLYMSAKFLNKKNDYKSKKFWIIYIFYTIYAIISYVVINNFIRVVVSFTIISFVLTILNNITFVKGIVLGFVVSSYSFFAELVTTLLIIALEKENIIVTNSVGLKGFIYNIIVITIMMLMTHLKSLNKISNNLIRKFDMENNKIILIFTILSLGTLALILYYIYFEINLLLALILGIILIIIFTTITLGLVTEKIDNNQLKSDYDVVLDNLSEYEKMYSFQRMKNHEYKNDLSVLRGMIDQQNKNALKYIDEIIDFRSVKKHNWMEILKRIPEGGLQGILYYKLFKMEELEVKIEFNASRFFSIATYNKLSEQLKIKICKILGIYLDNAIQAVENLETKKIYIEINQNKEFISFKVANNFYDQVNLERICEKGYTTKANGHGYGLAIAKEILDNEPSIINKTSIIKDNFVQEIKIKIFN